MAAGVICAMSMLIGPPAATSKPARSGEQQHKHQLAETGFIQLSIEPKAEPCSREQRRQADDKEPTGLDRDGAFDAEPEGAHGEDRHSDRLKHCALLVLGPATHSAPDGGENAGKAGEAAQHAIEKTDAGVGGPAASRHLDGGAKKGVHAVDDQNGADSVSNVI